MDSKSPLRLAVFASEDHAEFLPHGCFNALTGEQMDGACARLLTRGLRHFIVRFRDVETINALGISILVGVIEKVLAQQGMVYFTEMSGATQHTFETLGLASAALIFPSVAGACEHIQRDLAALQRTPAE